LGLQTFLQAKSGYLKPYHYDPVKPKEKQSLESIHESILGTISSVWEHKKDEYKEALLKTPLHELVSSMLDRSVWSFTEDPETLSAYMQAIPDKAQTEIREAIYLHLILYGEPQKFGYHFDKALKVQPAQTLLEDIRQQLFADALKEEAAQEKSAAGRLSQWFKKVSSLKTVTIKDQQEQQIMRKALNKAIAHLKSVSYIDKSSVDKEIAAMIEEFTDALYEDSDNTADWIKQHDDAQEMDRLLASFTVLGRAKV
jgi:hypothetical protein